MPVIVEAPPVVIVAVDELNLKLIVFQSSYQGNIPQTQSKTANQTRILSSHTMLNRA